MTLPQSGPFMISHNDIGYIPAALTSLTLVVLYFSRGLFLADTSSPRPPVYGPWFLPRFVRGVMAMVRLGADEDLFLTTARRQYGPVVYIPWPLGQTFVLDGAMIQKVYSMPPTTLSFAPIRTSMYSTVFGTPRKITNTGVLERLFYPMHGKGLANLRLDAPVRRFAQVAEMKLAELGERVDAAGGTLQIGLVRWVIDTMFEAGTAGLFGEEFGARVAGKKLQATFNVFDGSFPLLASEMFRPFLFPYIPPIAQGIKARDVLIQVCGEWVQDGMPGLEDGVVKDTADIAMSQGFSFENTGTLLIGDLWALQANAPYAAASLLLYVLQSPLLPAIRAEIASLPTGSASSTPDVSLKTLASMPLLTSCTQETIRLTTSSFSIRTVEKSFVLSASEEGTAGERFFISEGSRIVCATRVAHLSDDIWGEDPSAWDGERFMGTDEKERSRKAKEMRGFGGGISICEGRHLAAAELKSLLTLTLSKFDMTPLYPTSTDGKTALSPAAYTQADIKGSTKRGILPTRASQRPGLGAFQFDGADVIVEVNRRA